MPDTERRIEKRKFTRFKAEQGTYVAFGTGSSLVGRLLNISGGGMAFSYIAGDAQVAGCLCVDIFLSANRFYLKSLPFKAVSDVLVAVECPFSTVLMKQCGGKFCDLNPVQQSQLEYFITNYVHL